MLRLIAMTAALAPGLAFAQVADENLTIVYPEILDPAPSFSTFGDANAPDETIEPASASPADFGQDVVINDDIDLDLAEGTIVGDVAGEDPNTLVARVVIAEDGTRDLALSTVGGDLFEESATANHEIGECNPGVDWMPEGVHCLNLVPVDE